MGPDEDSLPETLANSTRGERERETNPLVPSTTKRLRRTTPTETWKGLRPFPSPLWMTAVIRLQSFRHELHSPLFQFGTEDPKLNLQTVLVLADRPLKTALLLLDTLNRVTRVP